MPQDPIMLLSYVNTKLRDFYKDLDEFCSAEGADRKEIEEKLNSVGYEYDAELNKFV